MITNLINLSNQISINDNNKTINFNLKCYKIQPIILA